MGLIEVRIHHQGQIQLHVVPLLFGTSGTSSPTHSGDLLSQQLAAVVWCQKVEMAANIIHTGTAPRGQ